MDINPPTPPPDADCIPPSLPLTRRFFYHCGLCARSHFTESSARPSDCINVSCSWNRKHIHDDNCGCFLYVRYRCTQCWACGDRYDSLVGNPVCGYCEMARDSTWRIFWGQAFKQLRVGKLEEERWFKNRAWVKFCDEGVGMGEWYDD